MGSLSMEATVPTTEYSPEDPLLNNDAARRESGRAISTWHLHRSLGMVPPPDAWNGRRPLWRRSTIRAWVAGSAKGAGPVAEAGDMSLATLAAEAAKQAGIAAKAAQAAADAARRAAAAIQSNP